MATPEPVESFIESVAKETWNIFKQDAVLFVLAALVFVVLSVVSIEVLSGPLFVGFYNLVARRRRGEPATVGDVFSGFDKFLSAFLLTVIVTIAVFVGSVCLILPGLIVAVFVTYAFQVVAFENASAIDAIKRSVELVRDNFVNTLVLLFCFAVAQAAGSALVFGSLVSTPLTMIASVLAYERIVGAGRALPLVTPSPL